MSARAASARTRRPECRLLVAAATLLLPAQHAQADAVSDWNAFACDTVVTAGLSPLHAARAMAIVQSAVHASVGAAQSKGASAEAAVAASSRAVLSTLAPSQQAAIERAYHAALAKIPDGAAEPVGIALGEQAATRTLAQRVGDDAIAPETLRPSTEPGRYVPTVVPVGSVWPRRRPWVLRSADHLRPGPPPALSSATWARDYNEIKAIGARNSTARTAEQTAIARFWEAVEPAVYFQIVRSVADTPGRDLARNARLYAMAAVGIDDALIAVFDAKYHYGFWRPLTAIRNGDRDDNDATERDASWLPFIDTPMHPEYPCAHCILASTVGTVLKADLGSDPVPELRSTSSKAPGAIRRWPSVDAFVQEVANARIYDGVHYRHSTEVGIAMGARIGALAAGHYDQSRE